MNKVIKEKWVAALRSGKYEQGGLALHDEDNKFCCLGVLCDLAVTEGIVLRTEINSAGIFGYGGERATGGLPDEVIKWSGVKSPLGNLPDGRRLSTLNDSGTPFNEIATVIEEQL